MFTTIILVVHIIVCVALILIILLQSGKGADIGAAFGGGSSQTVFGSTGATPLLSKITIGAAVAFMMTSIVLTYFSGRVVVKERSIVSEQSVPAVPIPGALPSPGEPSAPIGTTGEGGALPAPAATGGGGESPAPATVPAGVPSAPPAAETPGGGASPGGKGRQ
jgi:preprotein translocase subunit SecG